LALTLQDDCRRSLLQRPVPDRILVQRKGEVVGGRTLASVNRLGEVDMASRWVRWI